MAAESGEKLYKRRPSRLAASAALAPARRNNALNRASKAGVAKAISVMASAAWRKHRKRQ